MDKYWKIENEIDHITKHMVNLMTLGQKIYYVKSETGFDTVREWKDDNLKELFYNLQIVLKDKFKLIREERIKDAIEHNRRCSCAPGQGGQCDYCMEAKHGL